MKTAYNNYLAKPWFGSSHYWSCNQVKDIPTNSLVLDVGPGSGVMAKFLKEKNITNLYAIETDSATAKILANDYQLITASLNDLPKLKFDYVFLLDVLEHMPDPESFLQNLKPFLHQNSKLLISVPNVIHWSARLIFLFGLFKYQERGIFDKTHLRFFTKKSICQLFINNNFNILENNSSIAPLQFLLPEILHNNFLFKLFSKFRYSLATTFPNLFAFQNLLIVKPCA